MPELSTPPRRSSARAQMWSMSSARNGSSVRLTRTPPRVTDSVHRSPGACPAGSTSAPLCWARCWTQEATAAAGRSPLVVTREPVTASGAAPPLVPAGSHGRQLTGRLMLRASASRVSRGQSKSAGCECHGWASHHILCHGWPNHDKWLRRRAWSAEGKDHRDGDAELLGAGVHRDRGGGPARGGGGELGH